MKKTGYPIIKSMMLLWLLCLPFSSCLHDDFSEEESGIIVVTLDGITARAAGDPLFSGEETIDRVRIFVFVGNAMEKNVLFASGSTDFINPFLVEVATGNKDVYVVANESTTLATDLEAVTTKEGLMQLLADEIKGPIQLPHLLMTGSMHNVPVVTVQEPNRNSITVTLKRVAARIDLNLKKDTDASVQITKVSLFSNTGFTPLWENQDIITNQTYWDFVSPLSSPLNLSLTPKDMGTLYVYENITGGDKEKATQLEVEALYNGVPTKYRVYVNENVNNGIEPGDPSSSVTEPGDHLYHIKRNHRYQISGTVINIGEFDGLTLKTQVLPWNYLLSEITFNHVYRILPQPTPNAKEYTVDGNEEISFQFTLTNPIDATWTANLTNVTDFDFVGSFQGVTDETVTVVIKAKNDRGELPRETELYFNVGYGGNWTEVPLLQGSDLTGTGNRILIKQPAVNP